MEDFGAAFYFVIVSGSTVGNGDINVNSRDQGSAELKPYVLSYFDSEDYIGNIRIQT